MSWLILLHVLTAVVGFGPTFTFPFLLRKTGSPDEMKQWLYAVTRMELFPKVFGSLALLSGIALFWLGSYGPWLQTWIVGTLLVFAAVEMLVIGFLAPAVKKLHDALEASEARLTLEYPAQLTSMYGRVRGLHMIVSALGLVIIILMILKPH